MLVLDTNIVVAALRSRKGASFELLRRALSGEVRVGVSVALALEYEDVLKRASMREASWATAMELESVLDGLLSVAVLAAPIHIRFRPSLGDPDDEMVLDCALKCGARAIVTLNTRDFQPAISAFDIAIVSPGFALHRLNQGEWK
jgi:putative PIN family toxin of toxin-antitoxin system